MKKDNTAMKKENTHQPKYVGVALDSARSFRSSFILGCSLCVSNVWEWLRSLWLPLVVSAIGIWAVLTALPLLHLPAMMAVCALGVLLALAGLALLGTMTAFMTSQRMDEETERIIPLPFWPRVAIAPKRWLSAFMMVLLTVVVMVLPALGVFGLPWWAGLMGGVVVLALGAPLALSYARLLYGHSGLGKAIAWGFTRGWRNWPSTTGLLLLWVVVELGAIVLFTAPIFILTLAAQESAEAVLLGDPTDLPAWTPVLMFGLCLVLMSFTAACLLFLLLPLRYHHASVATKS